MRSIEEFIVVITGAKARRYTVEGDIVFIFKTKDDPTFSCVEDLREAIISVDKQFPWKDTNDHDGTEVSDFRYLSYAHFVTDNVSGEKHVCFRIVPRYENIRKTKLYAYERYLANLAQELSKKSLHQAISVRSFFRVVSVTQFKAQK